MQPGHSPELQEDCRKEQCAIKEVGLVRFFNEILYYCASLLLDSEKTNSFNEVLEVKMTRRCPLCRRETVWEDNPWRPFCSERCQTADLANWASENYRVPLTETPEGLLPAEFVDFDSDLENNFDEQK